MVAEILLPKLHFVAMSVERDKSCFCFKENFVSPFEPRLGWMTSVEVTEVWNTWMPVVETKLS
jgi:hypothetical protein